MMTYAQEGNDSKHSDAYDYPVKPGTEAWKALKTHDEMIQVSQVPEEILKKMSTSGLVETVLNYPLYRDRIAFNTIQQGFDAVAAHSNSLQALFNRQDAGRELLIRYQSMDPTIIEKSWTSGQRTEHLGQFLDIEVLMAQPEILVELTNEELYSLLTETVKKGKGKADTGEMFSIHSQARTAWLAGRILQQLDDVVIKQKASENRDLQTFLNDGTFLAEATLNEVYSRAQQVLSDESKESETWVYSSSDDCTPRTESSGYVYTPNGSPVQVSVRLYDYCEDDKNFHMEWEDDNFPNAIRLRDPSRKYNCYSYAWHDQSVNNNKDLQDYDVSKYWEDGSYTIEPYDFPYAKVMYENAGHAAISLPSSALIHVSKWGWGSLMKHYLFYSPYAPTGYTYYKRSS